MHIVLKNINPCFSLGSFGCCAFDLDASIEAKADPQWIVCVHCNTKARVLRQCYTTTHRQSLCQTQPSQHHTVLGSRSHLPPHHWDLTTYYPELWIQILVDLWWLAAQNIKKPSRWSIQSHLQHRSFAHHLKTSNNFHLIAAYWRYKCYHSLHYIAGCYPGKSPLC